MAKYLAAAFHRLRWLLLAAVPYSLTQSVCTIIVTDISPIPLLDPAMWVLWGASLGLVCVLRPVRWTGWPHDIVLNLHPLAVLTWWFGDEKWLHLWDSNRHVYGHLAVLVAMFLLTALVCHGELAKSFLARPTAASKVEMLAWMLGGMALGRSFNAAAAPWMFPVEWGIAELYIAVFLAWLLRPRLQRVESLLSRWLPGPRLRPAYLVTFTVNFLPPLLLASISLMTWWQTQNGPDPAAGADRSYFGAVKIAERDVENFHTKNAQPAGNSNIKTMWLRELPFAFFDETDRTSLATLPVLATADLGNGALPVSLLGVLPATSDLTFFRELTPTWK